MKTRFLVLLSMVAFTLTLNVTISSFFYRASAQAETKKSDNDRNKHFVFNGTSWPGTNEFFDSGSRCATETPNLKKIERIENELKQFRALQLKSKGLTSLERVAGSVTIRVYFHVINNGPGIANGDVPDSMLDDQIRVLNDTYGGVTGGFNTPFRFVKAGTTRTTNAAWFNMAKGSAEERAAKTALHVGGAADLNWK
jgi:hypothetical protein